MPRSSPSLTAGICNSGPIGSGARPVSKADHSEKPAHRFVLSRTAYRCVVPIPQHAASWSKQRMAFEPPSLADHSGPGSPRPAQALRHAPSR